MSFWLTGGAIALSCFALVFTATSLLSAVCSPALFRRIARYAPSTRARLLFQWRMLPAAIGLAWAIGVALPIYLAYEPRDNSDEIMARTLIACALAGGALLIRGTWRAASAWRATTRLMRDWRARGRRLHGFEASIPVFAIEESFPTVAVVGFSRPALFIAERVLRECTPDEVRAMVLHECAHVTHRDNLKRFLIRACPDVLRRDATFDRAWSRATEEAADARAVAANPGFALELAQALIRVARLAPQPSTLELASAFYLGGSIESRVRQLVEPANSLPDPSRPLGCVMALTAVAMFAALVFAGAATIHQVMEAAVRVLP
ncbi:MAG TPA: hypothetical protein VKH34_07920 [Vicinamibacterales bacterium]|nr:hypothetical protein [Vicinamibacterales bacterium]